MMRRLFSRVLLAGCLLVVAAGAGLVLGEEKSKAADIYNESADAHKQITDAVAQARKEDKRVLLQFGANWCPWCHKLHHVFKTEKDISAELANGYIFVLVDVNKGHNQDIDDQYHHPTQFGIPALVVLDDSGRQVTTKNTSELEEGDHYNLQKVLAFLKEWAPKRQG